LELGTWDLFWIWILEFGISKLAALTNQLNRRIFQHSFVGGEDVIGPIFFAEYTMG